jgi:type IV secretory pathway VirB2 component (pilin)
MKLNSIFSPAKLFTLQKLINSSKIKSKSNILNASIFYFSLRIFMMRWQRIYSKTFSVVFYFLFIWPSCAFSWGGETPVSQGGRYLLDAMYGATGITLATLAVMSVGALCAGGYLEWKRLLQTVVGIALIFGAGSVVNALHSLVSR